MGQGIKVSGWGVPEDVDIRFSKNNSGKLSPDKITSLSVIKGKGL